MQRVRRAAIALALAGTAAVAAAAGALPACQAEQQANCIAQVTLATDVHLERSGRFPACYLELWDDAALAQPACATGLEQVGPGARSVFRCRDLDCQLVARPQFGVSLEGGGSKASPFALGVLAGLQEVGLLAHTDIVASVSGGTYAASFLFNRYLDRAITKTGDPAAWFADCIPAIGDYTDRLPGAVGIRDCYGVLLGDDKEKRRPFRDAFPHAWQIRYHADLLAARGNLVQARGIGTQVSSALLVTELLGEHLVTAWPYGGSLLGSPHHLTHSLFDWPENFSPSRERYRRGIERAFGFTAAEWLPVAQDEGAIADAFTQRRRERSMATLSQHYGACLGEPDCRFPLWIIGTTALPGRGGLAWVVPPANDSLRHQFELTPIGYGSGIFGYARQAPKLPMMDAVGASAAFLDDQQSLFQTMPWRLLVGAGLHLINANWGTRLPNANLDDGARERYRWLPWPLYGMPAWSGREGAPYIHLTDGGNTDNLGLLALLRRGVRDVVIAAGTSDREGLLPSLCHAKNQLELDGTYTLHMPGLEDFDLVCNREFNASDRVSWPRDVDRVYCDRLLARHGDAALHADCLQRRWQMSGRTHDASDRAYDLFAWRQPVQAGCVVRGRTPAERPCEADEAAHGDAPRLIARLYLLKPAIDVATAAQQFAVAAPTPATLCDGSLARQPVTPIRQCAFGPAAWQSRPRPADAAARLADRELPCAALAFIANNPKSCTGRGEAARPQFPQHDFIFMTLNSSYTMFGAYQDLGRHLGAALTGATEPDPLAALRRTHALLLDPAAPRQPAVVTRKPRTPWD